MSRPELGDFNKICRLCLKEDSILINIFFSDAAVVISEITSIMLKEGDFLPENICIPCMDKSLEFYKFKQLCEESNKILQSVLTFGEERHNKAYDTDNIDISQENENNQKHNSFNNARNNFRTRLDDNMVENSKSENKFDISIPFKTRQHRKIEIKRSLKDLIPLQTYNNKNIKNMSSAGTLCKDTSEKIDSFDDISQVNIELEHEDIYHENGKEDDVDIKQIETEEIKLEDSDNLKQVSCKYCSVEFEHIEKHYDEYHPAGGSHFCHVCTKEASSEYKTIKQLLAHLHYHKQFPKYHCELCDRWFRFKHQKLVHMRLHTGERPAVCDICNKTFRDPRYLVVHMKSHTGEKPYKCTICQKGFGHKFSLKVHMKTHSSEREHMCSFCGKTFVYRHNLKIHFRQHTGEKPYNCHLCFTSFISGSVLRAHMLTHSDQKRFQCKECGKRFKRTGDLNVHMRSHTGEKPYACTVCSNRYKMSSHLTEHMKTHTGEKNYLCEICSKSFYNNKSLEVHKKTHTGQKTYNCQYCDKSFVHHTSLCAHQRKHHKQ